MTHDAAAARLRKTVASALKIDEGQVDADLAYQSVSEWDSSAHVALILALEGEFGVRVPPDQVLDLVTLPALQAFFCGGAAAAPAPEPKKEAAPQPEIFRGLNGVRFDRSAIAMIDGQNGRLLYRGYDIHDVAARLGFEETLHLLMYGELPTPAEKKAMEAELAAARSLPKPVVDALLAMKAAAPMAALRTGVSMMAAFDADVGRNSPDALRRKGLRLVSQIPLMIATHDAARRNAPSPAPLANAPHAQYALALMSPEAARDATTVRLFEQDLVVHMDHSSNASTFAARIATGTESDLHAAITAAIGTFAGALHGGAVEDVMVMIDEIGDASKAAAYVQGRLAKNKPVPGFGHRVYRTADPRAKHLRHAAWTLAKLRGQERYLAILDAVVAEMAQRNRLGIDVNVDFYAAVAYRVLGFPPDLYAPLFVMGRIGGWLAHVMEQQASNILIRPLLHYVGPGPRPLPAGGGRG